MRFAVLSDIHGNLLALQAVIDDLHKRGINTVVNLGDSFSGPLLPQETADLLIKQNWMHLAGNHERQLLTVHPSQQSPSDAFAYTQLKPEVFEWIRSLQPHLQFTQKVLLCHGSPRSDVEYLLETVEPEHFRLATPDEITSRLDEHQSELVLCGHTHIPRAVRLQNGPYIVNPGSVGLPAYADDRPYPHSVENGAPDARYAILEETTHGWSANFIALPYDSESMARLAHKNGRPDWAHALQTGFMPHN